MEKDDIARWYDESTPLYRYFWYVNSDSFALHYGLWDKETKHMHEALSNTNTFMATQVAIAPRSQVLDAGCGIGGSAFWLAKNKEAFVTGISISQKQVEKAQRIAKQKKIDHMVTFLVKDYVSTGFAKESFDVVWAIESVCHAEQKEAFLEEAYRVLKKGGKIMVADGFIKRAPEDDHERQLIADFYKGMLLPNLYTINQFETAMRTTGFNNIKVFDKTQEVVPSSKRFSRICRFMYPLIILAAKIHIVPDIFIAGCKAGMVQYEAVLAGLGGYGILYGEK